MDTFHAFSLSSTERSNVSVRKDRTQRSSTERSDKFLRFHASRHSTNAFSKRSAFFVASKAAILTAPRALLWCRVMYCVIFISAFSMCSMEAMRKRINIYVLLFINKLKTNWCKWSAWVQLILIRTPKRYQSFSEKLFLSAYFSGLIP